MIQLIVAVISSINELAGLQSGHTFEVGALPLGVTYRVRTKPNQLVSGTHCLAFPFAHLSLQWIGRSSINRDKASNSNRSGGSFLRFGFNHGFRKNHYASDANSSRNQDPDARVSVLFFGNFWAGGEVGSRQGAFVFYTLNIARLGLRRKDDLLTASGKQPPAPPTRLVLNDLKKVTDYRVSTVM